MNQVTDRKAVVLLSGGLDSTTTLAIAQRDGFICYALSIDYKQRHKSELLAAKTIAQRYKVKEHKIYPLDLAVFGGSALTDSDIEVPTTPTQGIPVTYVPARNTLFLSLALAWAEVLKAHDLFLGINSVDYSGYPDCRPEYISAYSKMANLATKEATEGRPIRIHTPLINKSKSEIIQLGRQLGVDYSSTVSCYALDDQGRACGQCEACRLRRDGFKSANVADPTRYW